MENDNECDEYDDKGSISCCRSTEGVPNTALGDQRLFGGEDRDCFGSERLQRVNIFLRVPCLHYPRGLTPYTHSFL